MVRQYRFDAFGNLMNLDTFPLASSGGLFNSFRNRLGHHGLFAERVDGDTTQLTLSPNPNAELWYQSRSRWYIPELGRFVTSDPNATGVPTMQSLSMLGRVPTGPPSGSFGAGDHYGDGWDTWTSYGGNPLMHQDPTGLFGFIGGMMTGLDMAEMAADAMDMAFVGVTQQMRVAELWTGYSLGQMDMVERIAEGDTDLPTSVHRGGIMTASAAGIGALFVSEFVNRVHGGQRHNAEIDRLARNAMDSGKYKAVYKNRGLRRADGSILFGSIRPDLQLVRNDGKIDIIEIEYSNRSSPERQRIIGSLQKAEGIQGSYRTRAFDRISGDFRWRR